MSVLPFLDFFSTFQGYAHLFSDTTFGYTSLLWDDNDKKPVLFLERIYPNGFKYDQAILEMAKRKAHALGLTLTTLSKDNSSGNVYPHPLQALGGPVPFEYVDAVSGINNKGIFTISSDTFILYSPQKKYENSPC